MRPPESVLSCTRHSPLNMRCDLCRHMNPEGNSAPAGFMFSVGSRAFAFCDQCMVSVAEMLDKAAEEAKACQ